MNSQRLARAMASTPLAMATKAAEQGYLADQLVRVGIRQMLRSRLRQLRSQASPDPSVDFLQRAQDEPLAVATDKANEQHYEVPASFFEQVLGHRLKYSCGFWSNDTSSLDEAEDAALQLTCEHAGLQDGDKVLELGCGWGSLTLWMCERFPHSHITAVSNSNSQRCFIERRARQMGLTNLQVITADINDFQPAACFDRVVSVEMFEHVRNHRELMNRIHHWLKPGGTLLVHLFCHRDSPYLFESTGPQNWMGRHFFGGGMMPSADLLPRLSGKLELASKWRWSGNHYARTCRSWLHRQDASSKTLQPVLASIYGVENASMWNNRWRLFFMACEELFAYRGGQEWFVSHYLFAR